MQKTVKKFNETKMCHKEKMPESARVLDIQSEFGELSKEILKATSYGTKPFFVTEDFKMEFGDVLYSMLSLACEVGVDAEECLKMAIKKYSDRIDAKKDMGSGR